MRQDVFKTLFNMSEPLFFLLIENKEELDYMTLKIPYISKLS